MADEITQNLARLLMQAGPDPQHIGWSTPDVEGARRAAIDRVAARSSSPQGLINEDGTPADPQRSQIAQLLMRARDRIPEGNGALSILNMLRGGLEHGANSMDIAGGYRDPSTMTAFDAPVGMMSTSFARPRSSPMPAPGMLPAAAESGALRSAGDLRAPIDGFRRGRANDNTAMGSRVMVSGNSNYAVPRPSYGGFEGTTLGGTVVPPGAMRPVNPLGMDFRMRPANANREFDFASARPADMATEEALLSARAYLRAAGGDPKQAMALANSVAMKEGTIDAATHATTVQGLLQNGYRGPWEPR